MNDKDLCYKVMKLQLAYEQRGLKINEKKFEYMILGNNKKENLTLEADYISGVGKCTYLEPYSLKMVTVTKKEITD
jgi:hypothetical protein